MPTVRDICTRALRKLDVVGLGDAPDGDEIAEALDVYNDMLHGWELQGVYISHVTQELSEDFILPDAYIEGTVYLLASRLSPNFVIPPQFDTDGFLRGLQRATLRIRPATMDAGLMNMPSQRYRRFF